MPTLDLIVNDRYIEKLNQDMLLEHREKYVEDKITEVCVKHKLVFADIEVELEKKQEQDEDVDNRLLAKMSRDVYENYEIDKLEQRLQGAKVLKKLTDIENPRHANKLVITKVVFTTHAVPYLVPKMLSAKLVIKKKNEDTGKKEKIFVDKSFELEPEQMARYADVRERERDSLNKKFAVDVFGASSVVSVKEVALETIHRVRIAPTSTSLIFAKDIKAAIDEVTGAQYRTYDVYTVGKRDKDIEQLENGTIYRISGKVIPDHRSQKVTLCIMHLARDISNKFDPEKARQLHTLFSTGMETIDQRVDWYVENFEKYSKIVKRRDIVIGSLLACFSPTYIKLGDEATRPTRGWVMVFIIGDSTTGKSEVVRCTLQLLDDGQYVVGEIASVVGLSGAVVNFKDGGGGLLLFF